MTRSHLAHGNPPLPQVQPRGRRLRWRREQLMAAGYDELAAHRLAADPVVDVHGLALRRERELTSEDPASEKCGTH